MCVGPAAFWSLLGRPAVRWLGKPCFLVSLGRSSLGRSWLWTRNELWCLTGPFQFQPERKDPRAELSARTAKQITEAFLSGAWNRMEPECANPFRRIIYRTVVSHLHPPNAGTGGQTARSQERSPSKTSKDRKGHVTEPFFVRFWLLTCIIDLSKPTRKIYVALPFLNLPRSCSCHL